MAEAPDLASEPEEQNRRGFLDAIDPVEPFQHYLGSSSNSGCTAATKSVEVAVGDGSAAGEAVGSAADAAAESVVEAAAGAVVEAAGGVANAVVGGILDGI